MSSSLPPVQARKAQTPNSRAASSCVNHRPAFHPPYASANRILRSSCSSSVRFITHILLMDMKTGQFLNYSAGHLKSFSHLPACSLAFSVPFKDVAEFASNFMDCNQGTILLRMPANFIQRSIWIILNKPSQLLPLFCVKYGGSVSFWPWNEEPRFTAFPDPLTDAIRMIAKNFCKLLSASHP